MNAKTSLSDALKSSAKSKTIQQKPQEEATKPQTTTVSSPSKHAYLPACREGKRAITSYFSPETSKQLRQIALDEDTTLQEVLREAINDFFTKRGKPPIA